MYAKAVNNEKPCPICKSSMHPSAERRHGHCGSSYCEGYTDAPQMIKEPPGHTLTVDNRSEDKSYDVHRDSDGALVGHGDSSAEAIAEAWRSAALAAPAAVKRDAFEQLLAVLLRDAVASGDVSSAIDKLVPGEYVLSKVGEARLALARALIAEALEAVKPVDRP